MPDEYPSPAIGACLGQTARLVQTAFQANGFEVPVVPEAQHDSARPAIYLGNTAFARSNGIEVERLAGWGYIQRAVGKDLIIAGHDHPARGETANSGARNWDRIGTAKAVADSCGNTWACGFCIGDRATIRSAASRIDLIASPAIEFCPARRSRSRRTWTWKRRRSCESTRHPAGGGF